MLSLLGRSSRFCDGVRRRDFLKAGALSFGATAFGLTDLLRAESRSPRATGHKAVINVILAGGPPHTDLWDPKPDAPSEFRGEFRAIPTNVAGVQVGEVFPRIAARMDKFAVVRSVIGSAGAHDLHQVTTGWPEDSLRTIGGRPALGPVLAKLQGAYDPSVPPFVGLAKPTGHAPWSNPGQPGFLGTSYAAFRPDGPGLANLTLNGVNREQLGDRRALLTSFDTMRRDLDASGALDGLDALTERALGVLTSSRLLDALDLSREDPRVKAMYGDGRPFRFQADGAPTDNEQLLLARRLVEAGVRCVTLSYGRWDGHDNNFDLVRDHGGKLDQGLSALVDDLGERGMLDDVTVVAWGEFGRTPRVNKDGGRDHWPQVSCALLAGGGMRTGQAVGATNRLGEYAKDRPVHFQEVFATLYHNLGLDVSRPLLTDSTGRPQYLVEMPPVRELI